MRAALAALSAGALLLAPPARAADLVVAGPDGAAHAVTDAAMAGLPAAVVTAGDPAHGASHRFEGPLLWAVLAQAGAVGAASHGQVRQYVLLTGQDGYTALLALGEIAPEFGDRPVIVADRMDGQPLGPEHRRVVVPGDKRGGRGVHDLVRVGVVDVPR